MAAAPRADFLPADQVPWADQDRPLPIGERQTNSQPSTVAAMLELLQVRPGQRVLDLGSGSGWTTAILAHLTGPDGSVLGVERHPSLVATSAPRLDRIPWARVQRSTEGVLGAPADGPFDRILVSAQGDRVPRELVDQLAAHGVMVLPVDGRMVRVTLTGRGPRTERFGRYLFVPLVR